MSSLFSHALSALAREPANLLLQRHSLQSLPEHAANQLMGYLLETCQLTTSHLHLFRSTATQAVFSGLAAPLVDGHLLAYLSEFQHLQVLQLTGCHNLKAHHLTALASSPVTSTLRVLVIEHCPKLTADGVNMLASACQQLSHLRVTGHTFKGLLSVDTFNPSLTSLSLQGLPSTSDETLGQAVAHLKHLEELHIPGSSRVTQAGVQLLQFLTGLKVLDIAWTQGEHGLLPAWPNLKALDMHNNSIDSISWQAVSDSHPQQQLHLQLLNLAHCHVQPELVLQLLQATAPSLQRLDLSHTVPSCTGGEDNPLWGILADATSLQLLNLAQSNGASPDGSLRPAALLAWQLAALRPSLRSLSLAGCALAVPALSGLSELRSLQELDLTGCSLADSHLSPLDALTALTALILDNNQSVTLEVTAPLEQDGTPSSRSGGEGMQREQEEGVTAWPDIWRQDGPPPQANGRGALSGSPVPGGQASPSVADGSGHHGLGLPHLAYLSCRRTGVTDAGLQLLLGGSAGARAAAAGPEPPGQSPLQCILLGSPGVTDEGLLALSQLAPGLRAITLQGCPSVTGVGLSQLSSLEMLQSVTVADCALLTLTTRGAQGVLSTLSQHAPCLHEVVVSEAAWVWEAEDDGSSTADSVAERLAAIAAKQHTRAGAALTAAALAASHPASIAPDWQHHLRAPGRLRQAGNWRAVTAQQLHSSGASSSRGGSARGRKAAGDGPSTGLLDERITYSMEQLQAFRVGSPTDGDTLKVVHQAVPSELRA